MYLKPMAYPSTLEPSGLRASGCDYPGIIVAGADMGYKSQQHRLAIVLAMKGNSLHAQALFLQCRTV